VSETDLVLESFELAAASGDDITAQVHETFIAADPQSGELMDHMDEHMLGRMMAEVLTVLMAETADSQRTYLHFEVDAHRAYGVELLMYGELMAAVRDTVRVMLGPRWNQEFANAWAQRIASVGEEIDLAAAAAQ
jgi:hypothetical protein